MAIEDLTGQLKVLKQHGAPDLQLSERAHDAYTRLISNYRRVLDEQRKKVANLDYLGNPGGYRSAHETKKRLELNAIGLDGIHETLDKYIQYLNEFEGLINAAFKRIQAEDQT